MPNEDAKTRARDHVAEKLKQSGMTSEKAYQKAAEVARQAEKQKGGG